MKPLHRIPLAFVLCATILFTGCPKQAQDTLTVAAKASNELAGDTHEAIVAVRDLYRAKVLELATKDRLAEYLVTISTNGVRFNDLVIAASKVVDKPDLAALAASFESVSAPFLQMLLDLKLLNAHASAQVALVIAALQTAVMIIAATLRRAGVVKSGPTAALLAEVNR